MEKLVVLTPAGYEPERRYIITLLLSEFLGLEIVMGEDSAQTKVTIQSASADDDNRLLLRDSLFQTPPDSWLQASSLPTQPLPVWDAHKDLSEALIPSNPVPIIYGEMLENGTWLRQDKGQLELGLDLMGSAFFMLTRYEEIVKPERDKHDRFPASASLAFQEAFLLRPIVNEYLEILWACLKRLWPQLERSSRQYRVLVSHDVDHPSSVYGRPWLSVLKEAAKDSLQRRLPRLSAQRLWARTQAPFERFDDDPYNTFDFLMSLSESYGLSSAFYFITDHSNGDIDGYYTLDMPWVQKLMSRMHERGHEIGLHPSYATYQSVQQTHKEFRRLRQLTAALTIEQSEWGGRQHYLRWQAPTSWQNWEDAGLDYDSTLSYADCVGFRCGICYEFSIFNLLTRHQLQLKERPLIIMEASLFSAVYMALSNKQALEIARDLIKHCQRYKGDFTLLWHNSHLLTAADKQMYCDLLEIATDMTR